MADFKVESQGQFGVPGVSIEQNLLSEYDPYSGIDLRTEVMPQNSCIRIEAMRFPETKNPRPDVPGEENLPFRDGLYRPVGDYPDHPSGPAFDNNQMNIMLESCTNDFPNVIYSFNELRAVCADNSTILVGISRYAGNEAGNTEIGSDTNDSLLESEIPFRNGMEACMSKVDQNTDLYFASDNDGRQSLGLFYPKNINLSETNFTDSLSDDIFKQTPILNMIQNGDGRLISEPVYNPYFTLGGESFKPQGSWDYINLDGVGINITVENTPGPTSNKVKSYIQNPNYDSNSHNGGTYGYAGYAPYIHRLFPATTWGWDEYYSGFHYDFEWAKWIRNDECYSHQRCLEFSATSKWGDTTDRTNFPRISDFTGNTQLINTDESEYHNIFGYVNNNEYRTNNQFCRIYNDSTKTFLNPYSALKVSFKMKTTHAGNEYSNDINIWNNLSEIERPSVEASVLKGATKRDNYTPGYDVKEELQFGLNAVELVESSSFLITGDEDSRGRNNSSYYGGANRDWNHRGHFWLGNGGVGSNTGGILTGSRQDSSYSLTDGASPNNSWDKGARDDLQWQREQLIKELYDNGLLKNIFIKKIEVSGDMYDHEMPYIKIGNYIFGENVRPGNNDVERYFFTVWSPGDPVNDDLGTDYSVGIGDSQVELSPISSTMTDDDILVTGGPTTDGGDFGLHNSVNTKIILGGYENNWNHVHDSGQLYNYSAYRQFQDNTFGGNISLEQFNGNYFENKYLRIGPEGGDKEIIRIRTQYMHTGFQTGLIYLQDLERGVFNTNAVAHGPDEVVELLDLSGNVETEYQYYSDPQRGFPIYNRDNPNPNSDFQGKISWDFGDLSDLTTQPYSSYREKMRHESQDTWAVMVELDFEYQEVTPNPRKFYSKNYMDYLGAYNTKYYELTDTYSQNVMGSMARFQNDNLNVWEEKTFTFNLHNHHNTTSTQPINISDLCFAIQTSGTNTNGFRGRVLLDDFEVVESYDFTPDVDVRKKLAADEYGLADLTKYYDKFLQPEEYKDSTAPLEAQFYFYPRYTHEKIFGVNKPIIHNDFRQGLFYLYNIDWGDGSPKEFTSEPEQLGENKAVFHTYKSSGIFEITGTMLRLKANKDYEPEGVVHNKKFSLFININEGLDEDFIYFGGEGSSYIPYKNTLPVIGGFSEQSIYYQTIKRQLGIISDNVIVDTEFKSIGDRLKTEIALDKMDNSYTNTFDVLEEYKKQRYSSVDVQDNSTLIYNGVNTLPQELGDTIGNLDLTEIRYFDEPRQMWQMLGFEAGYEPPPFNPDDFNPSNPDMSTEYPQNFLDVGFIIWTAENTLVNTDTIPEGIIKIFSEGEAGVYNESLGIWIGSLDELVTNGLYWFGNNTGEEIIINGVVIPPVTLGVGGSNLHPGSPSSKRYWKNIIPKNYSIYNRDGIDRESTIPDNYSLSKTITNPTNGQTWNLDVLTWSNGGVVFDDEDNVITGDIPYYPVLPKYGRDGKFIEGSIMGSENDVRIPFPIEGPITNENLIDNSLKISINTKLKDSGVLEDNSGKGNFGFPYDDFKPKFTEQTLKPKKIKRIGSVKKSNTNGAF